VEALQAELSQRVPGIEFILVSCLSKESILLLQQAILSQAQKAGLIGGAIPANFKNVQKTLRELNLSLIPWQRFQTILEQVCFLQQFSSKTFLGRYDYQGKGGKGHRVSSECGEHPIF